MYQYYTHSLVLVFQPIIEAIWARICHHCTLLIRNILCLIYPSFISPYSASPILSSATTSATASLLNSLACFEILYSPRPSYTPYFSHHRHETHAPSRRSVNKHGSSIICVTIYRVMVFWRQRTYVYEKPLGIP